ncbi:MAG: hypothetical protein Q7R85_00100 [bacterium]|nr:hypothetical protein [bacterium]
MPRNAVPNPTKIGQSIFTWRGVRERLKDGLTLVEHERFNLPPGQCSRALLAQCKFQERAAWLVEKGFLPCFHPADGAIVIYKLEPLTKWSPSGR